MEDIGWVQDMTMGEVMERLKQAQTTIFEEQAVLRMLLIRMDEIYEHGDNQKVCR